MGHNKKRIIIISRYWVCNQKFGAALMTVSAQQTRLMQAQGIPNPNPQKQFITDLITRIQQWHQAKKEIVLCIDANKPVDDPCSDISRLFSETDLIDLHHHLHPGLSKPATHQHGSYAIDLMAGSPLAATAMTTAWIHSFGNPGTIKGDHWMLGIDFNPNVLFGTQPILPVKMLSRGVHSHHNQTVNKFCT